MQDATAAPTNFATKSASWRIAILAAGVTMNVLLAAVLLSIQAGIGFPTLVEDTASTPLVNIKTYIVEVAPNSPAEAADIKALDRVVAIESIQNPTVEDIQNIVATRAGQTVNLEVERQGQHHQISLTPRLNPPPDQGALGVNLAATGLKKVPWWQAPWYGVKKTGEMLYAIVYQFGLIIRKLFTEGTTGTALTGPIGIAVYANEATKLGASYLLEFGALISLNLAIINILPLPALDGGRIVFVLFEKIRGGRRLPVRVEQITHSVGFALLILLMLFITFKDIRRFF